MVEFKIYGATFISDISNGQSIVNNNTGDVAIAINKQYGGFSLSTIGQQKYHQISGELYRNSLSDVGQTYGWETHSRMSYPLIRTILELKKAAGKCPIEIVWIPQKYIDAEAWIINSYDGSESLYLDDGKMNEYKLRVKVLSVVRALYSIRCSNPMPELIHLIPNAECSPPTETDTKTLLLYLNKFNC